MSFLRRLFGSDPAKLVEQGERALTGNQPAEALDRFHRARAAAGDSPEIVERVDRGLTEAANQLVTMNIAEADLSQEAGDLESAMHHLQTAQDLCQTDQQRARVEARLDLLDDALQGQDEPQRLFTNEGAIGEELTPEEQWEHLLATLDDDVAEDYLDRDTGYRDSVLALNDGRPAEAEPVFREAIAEDSEDVLAHFELGRTLLLMEKFEEAAQELAVARQEVGFDPLDRMGILQIALMEGDALVHSRQPRRALELVTAALEEREDDVSLLFLRARAERALAEHDALETTMARVMALSPQLVDAAIVLAESRIQRGDLHGAPEALEGGVKRHCATGTCKAQPISAPAARLLATIYLDQGKRPQRVREVLVQLAGALEGHRPWNDLVLWGRLHKLNGDAAALAEIRAEVLQTLPPSQQQAREEIERLLAD